MFPAGNTRSKSGSATPNNTPAKARGKSSDGGSVGKMMSALALRSSSPESDESEDKTVNTVSLKRLELFSFLGKHQNAHKDPHLHDQFCGLLEEFTKGEEVSPSDPIFHIAIHSFGMKQYKLVLLGGPSVGKSTYITKLKNDRFLSAYQPTSGVEVTCLVFNTNSVPIIVHIWELPDGAGTLNDGYFVGAHMIMLMYDVNSKPTMKELTARHKSVVRVCGDDVPMVLVGNKAESNINRKMRQKEKDVVVKFCRKKNLQHTEISLRASKLGLAFDKPFLYLLKKLTGESSLKLTGKQKGELKPSTQQASSNDKKTPEALMAKYKQMKKKGPAGAKDKSADISVAAATPLPKVDEQEGF